MRCICQSNQIYPPQLPVLLQQHDCALDQSSHAKAFYTSKAQKVIQTYLHYYSDYREKPATYLDLHSAAQRQPHVLS